MNRRPPVPTGGTLTRDEAKKQRYAALIPVIIGLLIVLGFAGYVTFDNNNTPTVFPFSTGDLALAPMTDDPAGPDPDYPRARGATSSATLFHELLSASSLPLGIEVGPALSEPAGRESLPPSSGDVMPSELPSHGMMRYMASQSHIDDLLTMRASDRSLGIEPADLPAPANGQRIGGFVRTEGHVTDELTFWKVNTTHLHEIIDQLSLAAGELNFTPLARTGERRQRPAHTVTRIFTRTSRLTGPADDEDELRRRTLPTANDVLVLRVRPTSDGQIHLTVWYRHATTPPVGRR